MRKKTHEEFIAEMRIKHPNLKIMSQYKSNREKVIVEDLLGIQYDIYAGNLCKGQKPSINSALDKNLAFKLLSEQIHGRNNFDYSESNYTTNDKKVKIKCLSCKTFFYQQSSHHLFGNGCPECAKNIRGKNKTSTRSNTITTDIISTHGDNIKLDKFEYKGSRIKSLFGCNLNEEHGYWLATPDNIVHGKGCPVCKSSQGERQIANVLNKLNISFVKQKTFDGCKNIFLLKFDFYIPEFNLCIEYDGQQHFKSIEVFGGKKGYENTVKNDEIKTKFCKSNNITLLRISYKEKDIQNIVEKFINKKKEELSPSFII